MPRFGYRLLLASVLLLLAAAAEPPAELRRGINIVHWFRYPPSRDPAALRAYLDDTALAELRRTGFTFVRLPVQPDLLAAPDALVDAVARMQRHGLAVVIALFGTSWHLETTAGHRAAFLATWGRLAPLLRRLPARLTYPEVLNEPVFHGAPEAWEALQRAALHTIRASLPQHPVILTGAGWGGIDGLLATRPDPDPNVIYSFHFYEPAELTALGAYRPGPDAGAMARLPFPATEAAACRAVAATVQDQPTAELMRFYCAQQWDAAKLVARIAAARAWALRHQVPLLAGEFGASERLGRVARLAWLRTVREACEREGIGWALWGYDDSMGLAQAPGRRMRIDPALLDALGIAPLSIRETPPRFGPVTHPR